MIFSARQLEEMHKASGHVALPRAARLTPLAQDWLKSRKLVVVYTDLSEGTKVPAVGGPVAGVANPPTAAVAGGQWLWWCDGPCGMAKAALSAHRDVNLVGMQVAADGGKVLAVAKELAGQLKGGSANGALVFVQSAAAAMLYLNRCASVRAVLGTNLQTVDTGIRQLAANVLVIEYPGQSLQHMKNLIGRFVKAKRELSPDTQRALQEVASCG